MKTMVCAATILVSLIAVSCEVDDVNVSDFLNDISENQGGDDGDTDDVGTCGDGIIQSGEECDDGNLMDGDECTSWCTIPTDICSESFEFDANGILIHTVCYCEYDLMSCYSHVEEGCNYNWVHYRPGDPVMINNGVECMCNADGSIDCGGCGANTLCII
jgi:cysteine-rich repeat protein